MFKRISKYFKDKKTQKELQKATLVYAASILGRVSDFIDSIPDLTELAMKVKDMDMVEVQKLMAEELVKYHTSKENKTVE
jgi:hypothetical protein